MRGSAHGIQFMNKNYVGYRDKCLKLGGIQYQHLERYWHANYNPFSQSLLTLGLRNPLHDGSLMDGFKISHFNFYKNSRYNFFLAPNNIQQNGKLYF